MPSTRVRTCSFLCSNSARSLARVPCRWRSARFSSCSCSTVEARVFDAFAEPGELQVERRFCCFAHGQDYRASLFARSMRSVRRRFGHNTRQMHMASYADIQRVLIEERSMSEPAEAHGTLAGSLCTAVTYRFEDWLLEILPEGRTHAAAAAALLREVYAHTAESLVGVDLAFELLLPEEEQPIDARTAALAQWCQGFLYGLGSRVTGYDPPARGCGRGGPRSGRDRAGGHQRGGQPRGQRERPHRARRIRARRRAARVRRTRARARPFQRHRGRAALRARAQGRAWQ